MLHASARSHTRRLSGVVTLIAAAAIALTGCTAPAAEEPADASSSTVVTIEHAHGTTVIPEKPKRIVALGWMTPDIVAALGENPVGVEEVWGADESGYLPWFNEFVTDTYGETPEIIPYGNEGPNFEGIKELKPDLILGLYTGITDVEYERLSEIAPTVPYIKGPWDPSTWEEMTRTVGKAMWEDDRAEELITETEDLVTSLAGEHPEFSGKTFVWGLTMPEGSTDLGVYLDYDPRVRITEALGFTSTSAMDSFHKSAEGDNWYTGVSLENLSDVEADVFAAWGASKAEATATVENKIVSKWNPIANGSYVIYNNQAEAAAISSPTVLSLQYILPKYVDDLAAALQGEPTNSDE